MMVKLMRELAEEEPRTLFVVGSYHIGKERAYLGPARQLGWRVYCPPNKMKVGSPSNALFCSRDIICCICMRRAALCR